jgi:hypothetical protein
MFINAHVHYFYAGHGSGETTALHALSQAVGRCPVILDGKVQSQDIHVRLVDKVALGQVSSEFLVSPLMTISLILLILQSSSIFK